MGLHSTQMVSPRVLGAVGSNVRVAWADSHARSGVLVVVGCRSACAGLYSAASTRSQSVHLRLPRGHTQGPEALGCLIAVLTSKLWGRDIFEMAIGSVVAECSRRSSFVG